MYNKKILWSGLTAIIGTLVATPTMAQVVHDSGGSQVSSPVSVPVPQTITSFGSGSGSGSGAGLGSSSGRGTGLGTPTIGDSGRDGAVNNDGVVTSDNPEGGDRNTSLGRGECSTVACISAEDGSQISLNDAAKLLEENLDTSLAAAEKESRISSNTRRNALDEDTRHIVRNTNSCPVPDRLSLEADREIKAREILERQVAESQKFVEQVNLIDPDKNIW